MCGMSSSAPHEFQAHEFQAEVRQLLDLMVHSLYSHKDIFLRELVSNASDALDKVRFAAVTQPELAPAGELEIRLEPDAAARTLTVRDNGIGMSRDEVVQNIGTIARSGTKEFLAALRESRGQAAAPELIGQFGVGFYASFMVADRITLVTRKAGEATATRWESTGAGYTLADAERDGPGTTVTLHLKPTDEEDGLRDYTAEPVLREIVKKYSDFVSYPVRLGADTLNSMKAIWARPKDEVTEEEYREFYKHIAHDWTDPLEHLSVHVEGTLEARALLYIPAKAPLDLWRDRAGHGVQLYVKRVFIMDDCKELLPAYLRFVRGVVASDDLTLNVSREILQKDRQIQAIRRHLVRRLLAALKEMKEGDADKYRTFWAAFGAVLKEGMLGFEDGHDKLLELVLGPSTHAPGGLTSLAEYVTRMKTGQDAIYYMTGPSIAAVEHSPHLEAFREKGYEVLFFTDPVDDLWLRLPRELDGKKLVSAAQGVAAPGSADEQKEAEAALKEQEEGFKDLLLALRARLQDHVKDVRLSSRLTSSPACLVGEQHDLSPHVAELLRRSGQDVPKVKRILELNPTHPLLPKLQALVAQDKDAVLLTECAELLYGQAILAEGGQLPDPAAFSKRLADLLVRVVA
jgi:molecular chaperone HtpG